MDFSWISSTKNTLKDQSFKDTLSHASLSICGSNRQLSKSMVNAYQMYWQHWLDEKKKAFEILPVLSDILFKKWVLSSSNQFQFSKIEHTIVKSYC